MTARNFGLCTVIAALSGVPMDVAGQPHAVTEEIVHALEARQRASVVPEVICALETLPSLPDQEGYQEIESRLGPNTYIARYASRSGEHRKLEERKRDIERLDFLASVGFFEARDAVISRGFIETDIPARDYKLSVAGWMAGLGGCLYGGRVELLRALDYTESAPGPNGFRTLKVRTLVGVRYPPEWARSETARRLFPVIQQHHEGVPRELTLYRNPQGQLDTADTYLGSLKHLYSEEQTRARESRTAVLSIDAANRILSTTPTKPGLAEGQALPEACLELFPGHTARSPSLFTRATDGDYSVQIPKTMTGSAVNYAMLYARMRAMRLAEAGLASLETPGDADGTRLSLRLTPQIAELVAKHGPCLPVGETKIELMGIGITGKQQGPIPRPRIYARAQVIKPATWTRNTPAFQRLPELAAMLQSGVFFEVDVSRHQDHWRIESVRSLTPAWVLPRLDAIGVSPSWHAGYRGQRGYSSAAPSVKTYALHVLAAHEGTPNPESTGPRQGEIEVDVQPLPRPALIVLSAYERTHWRFRVAPNARIGAVLALGYHPQIVTGLPSIVPVVSAVNMSAIAQTPVPITLLGRVPRIELHSRNVGRGGGTAVILGRDGPTTTAPGTQIIERRPKEHLVIPHGVQIIEQGPGQYQIKGFEGSTANDVVSAESLARIREFFGVLPATVNYRYTGSRFLVDGRESL